MGLVFSHVIRELDEAFLLDQREAMGRQTEQTKPPKPPRD